MTFNPFSALTSKLFGGLSLVLLLALGVQTWRANHYHARWEACEDGRRADRAAYIAAQQEALRRAVAAKEAQEADYRAKAKEADHEHEAQLASVRAATDEFIRTHRVRYQAPASPRSGPVASPQGGDPGVPAGVSPGVVVDESDVQTCGQLYSYAVAARAWALSLGK